MRSALWSVACLAGSVLAAPQWGSNEPNAQGYEGKGFGHEQPGHYGAERPCTTCTDEEAKANVAPSSYAHPEQAATSSAPPTHFTHSLPGSSPSYSAAAAPAEYPETKVIQITTIDPPVSSVTPIKPVASPTGYALSESKCAAYDTTTTEITAVYATPYPGTSTDAHGTAHTYERTSTVTSVKTLTIVVSQPSGVAGYDSGNVGSSSEGSGSQNGGSKSGSAGKGASDSQSGGSSNENGGNDGSSYGDSGALSISNTESLLVEPSQIWTTIPWGTTLLSYTIPATTSTSSVKTSATSTRSVTAPATYTGSPTSTCSKPTATPMVNGTFEHCVPCEGQPGSDPDNFCGYTIHDNWYEVTPKTCRVREYHFEMTNITIAPDGVPRMGLVINGQLPGPKIEASWGDTIIVHVKNSMPNNGSTLHFHGVRQHYTNEMDGVPSITQCPIAPGDSLTYTFTASNYGSSWYHSHFAIQTYEGIFGPMTIHGPAAEEYDFEETVVVQDWSHATVDSMYQAAETVDDGPPDPDPNHGPRTLDTGLINGMNIWGSDEGYNSNGATGQRWEMNVVSGKTYRLRLVNAAIQSTFKFYIDGHKFKVIANDFVPIVPYETNIVNINIGQRYDLIFKADQPIGNYWMRADNQNVCAVITEAYNIKGIVRYVGALPRAVPTSTAYNYTVECVDEPLASLVPIFPLNAGPAADQTIEKTVVVGVTDGTPHLYKWTLSGTTFQSQWGDPTLSSIVNNGTVPDYSGSLVIEVPKLKEWVYVIIDSPIPLPHPIHLHGHDFLILAQGYGMYSSDVVLNTVNPPRRDVALMPADPVARTGGYLVLAYESDNPGVWLLHCHIGWHVAMGFALQIVENLDGIQKTVKDSCQAEDTCKDWHTYARDFNIHDLDSGV
ncbi:hypothetical protein AC578_435 [Lecanosticta acicola]|uniref:Laccase n=1 Tax=Lecanosticta acicola TaxID=111012 RepID=A0AAI8Z7R6_9PEZI|nr:hypothetical protein AC578_435 [Lecanosticta acicola]